MASTKRLALVVNRHKDGALELAEELKALAKDESIEATIESDFPLKPSALEGADMCFAIGGDGTLLSVVNSALLHQTPVLGVNLGRLGFMAHYSPEEVKSEFSNIMQGHYRASERRLLEVTSKHENEPHYFLNDLVLKATGSKLIRIQVSCDGEEMNTYSADGIIISTPTGSTAYNLSAGGPIVHPEAKVIIATPINPHTLSNRAIVLDESHCLTIDCPEESSDVTLSGDGIDLYSDQQAFPLNLRIAEKERFILIQKKGISHHYILKTKLRWNGESRLLK